MRALASAAVASRPWWASSRTGAPVTDPAVVREVLGRAGWVGASSAELRLERGWPMPKVPLMLRFGEERPGRDDHSWWTLHVIGEGRLPYPLRRGIEQQRAERVDDLGAVVQTFPNDLVLEGAAEALQAATVKPALEAALSPAERSFEDVEVQVLTYKPSRRLTVRYRLRRSAEPSSTIFGKCFPPGVDEQVVAISESLLGAWAVDRTTSLRLPPVVGRVEEWNMLLWERQPGVSVHDLLDTSGVAEAVEIAGRCLSELHYSPADWSGIHDRRREIATLRSWIKAVATADVVQGGRLYRILQSLAEWEPEVGRFVPSHRDFYDKQLLVDGHEGGLLDLETASRAEAELDVANFLAHLELRLLQGHQLDIGDLSERFVEGYGGRDRGLNRDRLRWYRASTLLRLACVYFFRAGSRELSSRLQLAARGVVAEIRKTMN